MKKVSIYLMLLLACNAFSSVAFAQKVGSTSMQFLKVMPCARATALGDAYSVLASGAEAVFWNPASVARIRNSELSMTYLKWIFDTQQGAIAFATSLGSYGAIGLQAQYVDYGEIDEAVWSSPFKDNLESPGLTGRTFRPYAYLIGLTYAHQLTDKFMTGVTVKFAHESLYNGSTVAIVTSQGNSIDAKTWANGLNFDFGIWYNTGFRSIRLAASVQNFGANVEYAVESNPLPLALRVGVAANVIGTDALLISSENNRLGIAFDLFQPNDYAQQAHVGMEYEFNDMIALRMGYKFNYDADGFTAGVGVHQPVGDMNISVDYSYGSLNYNLGSAHRISVGAGF